MDGKLDESYGSSSSSFGWKLTSAGFYVYSNASTAVSYTHLLVPEEYDRRIIEVLKEENVMRNLATEITTVSYTHLMGFTVVPFGQGFKDMSPPTKELMKLVLEQKIAHNGHPVLHWMMDNIYIRTDPAGNIKPDKEKSTEKIDGAVATIMALDLSLIHI